MKKLFTLSFVLFAIVSAQAQIADFTLTKDTSFDIKASLIDVLKTESEMHNKANFDRTFTWERIVVNMPNIWISQVCDPIACWAPSKSDGDFTLKANATGPMIVDVYPEATAGTAYIKIKIIEKGNPTAITYGRYRFSMLSTVGVAETEATKLLVFPNPTADYFVLQGAAPLTTVDVLSVTGQVLRTFPYVENEIYEIQDLAAGTYFLNLNGENNKRLATKRIVKQ
jgi:hypothetical protein